MLTTHQRPAPGNHTRAGSGPSVWRHLDLVLVAAVLLVAAVGVLVVYSATREALLSNGFAPTYYAKKQAIFAVIGAAVMFGVAAVDYRRFRDWAPIIYGLSLFLLLAVFAVGTRVKGAQAWFEIGPYQFEPSEFAKLGLIVVIAAYAANFKGRLTLRPLLVILALALVPFALIFKQPDLGTALVLSAVLIAMVVIAGASLRQLLVVGLIAVIGVFGVVELGVLHRYQLQRLTSYLHTPDSVDSKLLADPNNTQAASEYNVVKSKNAISNGGLTGQGLFKGSQTTASEVPEQRTDFIWSAVGEQFGFVGSVLLLGLFLLIMWRSWAAAGVSRDLFGTLVCVGVLAMLVFQVFENIGMTMGIMPVAGIPLPWISYGGSAIIIEFAAVGLVLNVRMRRFS